MHSYLHAHCLNPEQPGATAATATENRDWLALVVVNSVLQWLFFVLYRPYINSRDMSENYVWGSVWSLGNNKHPPLFGWITHLWFQLFPTTDWADYLLNEVNLLVALVLLGLALRKVFDEEKTFIALALTLSVITLGIPYNYQYNANSAQFPFLTGYAWALLTALAQQRSRAYAWAGLFAGAVILCKYSAILLIAPITLVLWAGYRPRLALFLPRIALTGAVMLLVLSPHLYWGMQHHWPSLGYMEKHATGLSVHYLAPIPDRLGRILSDVSVPLAMLAIALLTLGGTLKNRPGRQSSQPRLGLAIFATSIVCVFIGACIERLRPHAEWFIVCTLFFGWAMVDILPQTTPWKVLKARMRWLLALYFVLLAVFVGNSIKTRDRLHTPVSAIAELLARDITASYHARYHQPIAYAAGSYPLAYDMAFYSPDHPDGVYQLDVPASTWIDGDAFEHGSKVVVCSTEKRDYIKDPACTRQALSVLGRADSRRIFTYQAYDPHLHGLRALRYSVLMYRGR